MAVSDTTTTLHPIAGRPSLRAYLGADLGPT